MMRAVVLEEFGGALTLAEVGGGTLDKSFEAVRAYTGHVVSALGWGTHSLAPLSFSGATYSGIFTLLPMLTGRGRAHHGEILREAAALADAGTLRPVVDARRFTPGRWRRPIRRSRTARPRARS